MSWRDFKLKGYLGGSTALQNYKKPWFDLLNLLDRSVQKIQRNYGIKTLDGDRYTINTALNDVVWLLGGGKRQAESREMLLCYNVDLTHFRNHVSLSQTWLHGTAVHQRAQSEGAARVFFHT